MYKKFSTSIKRLPVFLTMGFLVFSLTAPFALAQTGFSPPTLLPAEEVEGYGSICIGLADAIRTGDLHLNQIPCFIKYFSQTLIGIAGTLAVIFVMIGGYQYMLGSGDQKDKAKNTILYALIGLAVTLMAWVLVDIVLQFATE
jgi:hypothetical protein